MKKEKLITRLQTLFGAGAKEITFVGIVLLGLLIGAIARYSFRDEPSNNYYLEKEVYKLLDSLAEAQNHPKDTLTDTANEGTSDFPSNKKALPKEKIDLNTASKVQLIRLPGIGEKTAEVIIEFRKTHVFAKPSDITKIKGIGAKKFEKIKPYIEVK